MAAALNGRIQSGLAVVQCWDSDSLLLSECRKGIPFHLLCPEEYYRGNSFRNTDDYAKLVNDNPYADPDEDDLYEGDDLLLKRLAIFFQKKVMTWVNNPSCPICGCKETKCHEVRGPLTHEEHEGHASRVELYYCPSCDGLTTTFPRYNSPKTLLKTRQGRCGEYANLFGLFCRAAGFETRYILDFTDHVWVEVWSHRQGRWIMADSCEGKIDVPSMYEKGWGKKLSYILAFTPNTVTDVTYRYTRNFHSLEFQKRRRVICPGGDSESAAVISQMNDYLRKSGKLSQAYKEELDRRVELEQRFFQATKECDWDASVYSEGRISGSLSWRIARGEIRSSSGDNFTGGKESSLSSQVLAVECFHPNFLSQTCRIEVRSHPSQSVRTYPECITVSGVPCAAGMKRTISIVVVHEKHLCILLSRMFVCWTDASSFLATMPSGRVIALVSDVPLSVSEKDCVPSNLQNIFGLLTFDDVSQDISCDRTLLFIGQVNHHPRWLIRELVGPDVVKCVHIEVSSSSDIGEFSLSIETAVVPRLVIGRLPDDFMSFEAQLLADFEQKVSAFLSFVQKDRESGRHRNVGFTSRKGAPIYLVSNLGFPLRKCLLDEKTHSLWKTCHFVPKAVAKNCVTTSERQAFEVPFNITFFSSLFGPSVLRSGQLLSTLSAFKNTRLVALYFSAHWCPPCRNFTPILIEFYKHVKERVLPTQSLEIIFISSDRDINSFSTYFASMPWLAVTYDDDRRRQQSISSRYAVSGIPTLIVLDAISGEIVVTKEKSITAIVNAFKRGFGAIEELANEWIKSIPTESQIILETLKLSCIEVDELRRFDKDHEDYLYRKPLMVVPQMNIAPTESCTAENQTNIKNSAITSGGCLSTTFAGKSLYGVVLDLQDTSVMTYSEDPEDQPNSSVAVISTAKRYIDNVLRDPSCSRYRNIRLSNKVFDIITSSPEGIHTLLKIGFSIFPTDSDYIASVPLASNLEEMLRRCQ